MHYYTTKIRLMWHPQGMWGGAEEIMMRHVKARLYMYKYIPLTFCTVYVLYEPIENHLDAT